MPNGFESRWVSEIVEYTSHNNIEALIYFIDNHSDEQLIMARADLREYIGRYSSIGSLWAMLSIYVAVGIVIFPTIYDNLSNLAVDHMSFWVSVFIVPMSIGFIMLMRPHRIGKYHRALSMLEDSCKKMERLQ